MDRSKRRDLDPLLDRVQIQDPGLRVRLAAQARKFAFSHLKMPLNGVVVRAFFPVHEAVMYDSASADEAAMLFGIFDWDKAKPLREMLIEAFTHSNWPPGDFVLAAGEKRLLKELLQRLQRRRGGERFFEASLRNLNTRKDTINEPLANEARFFASHPDLIEEWD